MHYAAPPVHALYQLGTKQSLSCEVVSARQSYQAHVFVVMKDKEPEPVAMSHTYYPSDFVLAKSRLPSFERYKEIHQRSLDDPEGFWNDIANEFYWQTPYEAGKFMSYNFDINMGKIFVKWMEGAVTNVCFNVLDRHVRNGHGEKVAFYW